MSIEVVYEKGRDKITVDLGDGIAVDLDMSGEEWTWTGEDEHAAEVADILSEGYTYSPSHGEPGLKLASIVAEGMEGKRVLAPELPSHKEGTIH